MERCDRSRTETIREDNHAKRQEGEAAGAARKTTIRHAYPARKADVAAFKSSTFRKEVMRYELDTATGYGVHSGAGR